MKAIRYLLFPFAVLYNGVTRIRNTMYDWGLLSSQKFDIPVIAVGNLSVGGTGKTPQIEYLIRLLKSKSVATLSRGYKRKTSGFILVNDRHTSEDVGDEPLQYHKKFSNISVAVDADRAHGIQELQRRINPEVILLDDAFQHRKVEAGLYILLTKYDDLFSTDFLLPTGNLREGRRGARRADIIIVTKCPQQLSSTEKKKIKNTLCKSSSQSIFFTSIFYRDQIRGSQEISLSELKRYEICLVTGIANPKPLLNFLNEHAIKVVHLNFPDHHEFTQQEISHINQQFNQLSSSKKLLLTTEKDYMRLSTKIAKLNYIEIESVFLSKESEFNQQILNYCNTNFL